MSKPELNIGIIGYNFMGKAHSNAWLQANKFFDAPYTAVLKAACGRNEAATRAFADNWGWENVETDWRKVVGRDDIDVIDIATPQVLHHDIAYGDLNRQGAFGALREAVLGGDRPSISAELRGSH